MLSVYIVKEFQFSYLNQFCLIFVLSENTTTMRKRLGILLFILIFNVVCIDFVDAQCSICTKTAGQLGEKKATSLNSGIVYLMLSPFVLVGIIGYRWWRSEKEIQSAE